MARGGRLGYHGAINQSLWLSLAVFNPKLQLGIEYPVVSEDDYGKRALLKLNVIPVIPSLIKHPLF